MPGLLIAGLLVDVPGVTVIGPGELPWARLNAGDCRPRKTTWCRQITIHTTKGLWPQHTVATPGSGGKDRSVADYWSSSAEHGGAHLIVDDDGSIVCLCDLVKVEAYHATTVNEWSVGIEMYQAADGGITEATYRSTVALVLVLCDVLGIPLQSTNREYRANHIIERLRDGGRSVVGVFAHHHNAWKFAHSLKPEQRKAYPNGYANRGRGDPGDEIFARLRASGMMTFDIDAGGELVYWRKVQQHLNAEHGEKLTADGVCGPGTVAALRRAGLWSSGVFVEMPIA